MVPNIHADPEVNPDGPTTQDTDFSDSDSRRKPHASMDSSLLRGMQAGVRIQSLIQFGKKNMQVIRKSIRRYGLLGLNLGVIMPIAWNLLPEKGNSFKHFFNHEILNLECIYVLY